MTSLIILAAGSSARLGFPKQTLLYKGKTLLELAIEAGLKSKCDGVTVVLGANAEAIEPGIKSYGINIIHNPNWADGMASSIAAAISSLQSNAALRNVVVMLCDQPFVNRSIIDSLLYKQQQTGKRIVACTYKDTVGVPALFARSLFDQLLLLTGQEGAKKIITDHPQDVATIPFEKGGIDIDTIADYEDLINNG
jgi:molybdenum cofactor cytidylyltransferase